MSSVGGGAAAAPVVDRVLAPQMWPSPQCVLDLLASDDPGQESAGESVTGTDFLDHVDGERRDFDGDVLVEAGDVMGVVLDDKVLRLGKLRADLAGRAGSEHRGGLVAAV